MNGAIRTVPEVTTPKVTATAAAPSDEIVTDGAACGGRGGGGGAESISEVPRPNMIQGRRHVAVVSLARPPFFRPLWTTDRIHYPTTQRFSCRRGRPVLVAATELMKPSLKCLKWTA